MKRTVIRIIAKIAFIAATTLSYGCGGGGGSTNYSGSTAIATVTANNAKTLSVSAYQNTEGALASGAALAKSVNETSVNAPLLVTVDNIIEDAAQKAVTQQSRLSAKTVYATMTRQGTMTGYSGMASYSITVDDTSGACSGALVFTNYTPSAGGYSVNGSVSFSGMFNFSTGKFSSFSITLSNLSAASGSNAVTMNGNLSATVNTSTKTIRGGPG